MNRLARAALVVLAASVLAPWPRTSPADDSVAAVWEPHEIKFHYAGFTTFYTCDGIRHKLEILLEAMGARHDVKTQSRCYGERYNVQPFNTVILGFAVPVSAQQAGHGGPGETFPARWQTVRLSAGHPFELEPGDCELVDEFARQVLKQIHARDMVNHVTCVPHQQSLGQIRLEATVLVPEGSGKHPPGSE